MHSSKIITREEYMAHDSRDSAAKHHEYYMQFAVAMKESCKAYCRRMGYTPEKIREWYAEDPNLNNLAPFWMSNMDVWTQSHKADIAAVNNRINLKPTYSLVEGTCILKAYMKAIAGVMPGGEDLQ